MRIIVWGINYSPEETGIGPFNTGMCEWLARRGHDVEMVTTFPYYPAWKKSEADCGRLFRTDVISGVRVRRCWHFVPRRVTALKRILHEATFIGTSFCRLLFMKRPDVLVVVSPPLAIGIAARFLGFLWSRPYVFHVQDLQPDAAVGLGMLRPGLFTRLLYRLEAIAYKGAGLVTGISGGMLRAFDAKNVPSARVALFPNWVSGEPPDAAPSGPGGAKAAFCARHGLDPARPLAVYSGNTGEKQGLGAILDAAANSGALGIQWVIAGDGAGKAALEKRVARDNLAGVSFLPLQPAGQFEEMLQAADVCLVTQQQGSGQYFFPSKLLTLLAHGRPVVAVADQSSELATAVGEGEFGLVVPPGDTAALVQAVDTMAGADVEFLKRRAESGRRWVAQFARDQVLEAFEKQLLALIHRH